MPEFLGGEASNNQHSPLIHRPVQPYDSGNWICDRIHLLPRSCNTIEKVSRKFSYHRSLIPMASSTVTLQVPENLYQRLVNTANAVGRSLDEIMLQALTVGSPPDWQDVPEEFQTELAALDRLDNESLWKIAQSRKTPTEMEHYTLLLEKNQEGNLTGAEQLELAKLRHEADLFMLQKAQATVLLRWRGERLGAD